MSSCKTHASLYLACLLLVIDSLAVFVLSSGWLLRSSCHPGWSRFKDSARGLIAFLAWNGVPPTVDCNHPLTREFLPTRAKIAGEVCRGSERKEKKRKEKKRKEKKRKEKKRKDYAFRRQFNEKPSIIPGCPGMPWIMLIRLASHTCIILPQNALALAIIYAIAQHETLAMGNQDVQITGLCGLVILECCMGCMSAAKQTVYKLDPDQPVLLRSVRSIN